MINSRLVKGHERTDPVAFSSNASTRFLGSNIYGQGFLLTQEEQTKLIKHNPRNAQCIFPYLGGEEVNTSPTQTFDRYVINFGDMELEEAEKWPGLLSIVRDKVKPERDRLKDNASGLHHKKFWWQHGATRPALYTAIAPLSRCLVTACVTKHLCFSFQPTDRIFSNALYVFPLDRSTSFAVLQSRIHEPWVRLLSSSMKTDLRYAATDCFATFPFPTPDPRTVLPEIEAIGEALYLARATYMIATNQGLTKTYNALKDPSVIDPEVLIMREMHEQMDREVLRAYGWDDLTVPPYCPITGDDRRLSKRFENEVIDRLYELNAHRSADERRGRM